MQIKTSTLNPLHSPISRAASRMILLVCVIMLIAGCSDSDWRTASREPAGIALDPLTNRQAVIEFYAADAFSWRGWFAVHTWVAVKPENALEYTVFEVMAWRSPPLTQYNTKTPDRYWYGAKPKKILIIEGPDAAVLIAQIKNAVKRYPYANEYKLFPGPNSNTFPAWLGDEIPALGLKLPFNAIGSGYSE